MWIHYVLLIVARPCRLSAGFGSSLRTLRNDEVSRAKMTGIEMAGIALAVVPLCIYVLEHHEDELRPFRALWRYRKQYKRSIEDLGLCLVQLEDTISSVLRDAGISDDGRGIQALVQAYDPGVWNDDDQEAKLIAHFGRTTYEHGFEVKLRRIRDGIMKVSWILGLEKLGLCGGDDVSSMTFKADRHAYGVHRRSGRGSRIPKTNKTRPVTQTQAHRRNMSSKVGQNLCLAVCRSTNTWRVWTRTYNGWQGRQKVRKSGPPRRQKLWDQHQCGVRRLFIPRFKRSQNTHKGFISHCKTFGRARNMTVIMSICG